MVLLIALLAVIALLVAGMVSQFIGMMVIRSIITLIYETKCC